ncbi:MAG: AAA family ATPase, partial [Planctomycetota bacterium]
MVTLNRDDVAGLAQALRSELRTHIIGQDQVIDELLTCLAAGGHALLEGVPGLAKTLLVSSLAEATELSFNRIQFTPDLMPSDIIGTEVIRENKDSGERSLVFLPGPVFASIILADEINRTPPKTQAALLEAMQERRVSAGGATRALPAPFFVLATQNPLEQEGTYVLPEAQLDRFLMKITIAYPGEDDEVAIVMSTTGSQQQPHSQVIDGERLLAIQTLVRDTPVDEDVARYAIALVRASRPGSDSAIADLVRWGAGPRAGQALLLGAKARATLQGAGRVGFDDIRAVAHPVLRHRLQPNY